MLGLVAAIALGVGAMYAYDQQYVGPRPARASGSATVDLSGLEPAAAAAQPRAAYASLAEGELVLAGPDGPIGDPATPRSAAAPDVDAMVAEAMAVGRAGNPIERVIADARTALRGVTLEPRVTFDAEAPPTGRSAPAPCASTIEPRPTPPSSDRRRTSEFDVEPGPDGRAADASRRRSPRPSPRSARSTRRARVELDRRRSPPSSRPSPRREAIAAKAVAERIDRAHRPWPSRTSRSPTYISAKRLRDWTDVRRDRRWRLRADASTRPSCPATLEKLAKKIDQAPGQRLVHDLGGAITGVTPSKNGYKLDVDGTQRRRARDAARGARGRDARPGRVEPALEVTEARP